MQNYSTTSHLQIRDPSLSIEQTRISTAELRLVVVPRHNEGNELHAKDIRKFAHYMGM